MKGNFDHIVQSEIPVLVDFSAEWCGPCKAQSPVLADVAREMEGKLKVIKIDVDRNPMIAARFRVQGVPTLILFRKGQVLWRQSGLTDRRSLIQVLGPHCD
ncbi:MAG: thioredoxin [Bacteroidales bacterium]